MNILETIKSNRDGFSIMVNKSTGDCVMQSPNSGFMVSITDNSTVGLSDSQIQQLYARLLALGNSLNTNIFYIGYWDGYLDISINTDLLLAAVLIGQQFGQKTIYDCTKQEVIPCA